MEFKFTDRSPEFLKALDGAIDHALWAIGARAETHAKAVTPVDTGRLRNSIAHAETDDATYIGTNVEYAPYIEFGTRRNHAHHMLKRAATEHGEEYKAIVKAAMKNASEI